MLAGAPEAQLLVEASGRGCDLGVHVTLRPLARLVEERAQQPRADAAGAVLRQQRDVDDEDPGSRRATIRRPAGSPSTRITSNDASA